MNNNYLNVYLPDIVGKGYKEFWNFKGRYRVVKGSRASKKSKTCALNHIVRLLQYPEANILVVRQVFATLRDSVYSDLKWAIKRLGLSDYFTCTVSPLEITYNPTGQKILFRGLDDPLKTASISVEKGYLCWAIIEEAYEISKMEDFDIIDESIRGATPGCFKQITILLNPWNERHWIKHRFFDVSIGYDENGKPIYKERETPISEDGEIMAITTNYLCNEFLDESDLKKFEMMKKNNPRRYRVAGLGEWGTTYGLIFEKYRIEPVKKEIVENLKTAFGLDFGFSNDPTAFVEAYIDKNEMKIYIKSEIYKTKMTNMKIAEELRNRGFAKAYIAADNADPKSIQELKEYGIPHIFGAVKGRDSIKNGIQFLQNFEIIIDPSCENFINEIQNYSWKRNKFGEYTGEPIDKYNHLIDALRYGTEKHVKKSRWIY